MNRPKQQVIIYACILLLLQLIPLPANANDIYRCTVNGKTVFTDQPCDGKPVKLLPSNSLPAIEVLPVEQGEKPQYNSGKWYVDANGYKRALKVSKKYNAPLFIYYQADWCGYCRKLEKELLNKSAARKTLRQVVKVRITPENGSREDALFRRMGGAGYPTVLTQKNADTKPVKRSLSRKKNGQWHTFSLIEFKHFIEKLSK